ncbi:MAG: hypothetical protein IJP81_09270 [Bacteroidales bacterium]|nr:hypothetical protein [Bacteroidales bacterium]
MKQKELYTAPETEVLELRLEGVIATSITRQSVDEVYDGNAGGIDVDW